MKVFVEKSLPALGILLIFLCVTSDCHGGIAHYLYDDLGRLKAVDDGSGNYAAYDYDKVGNLLSISNGTINPNPPVIQNINPDVFFIGATTPISITGTNLFTTTDITTDVPLLTIKILSTTDTVIKAAATVDSKALPGPANLTVTAFYGSITTKATLTSSTLSVGPGLLVLSPGGSGVITAGIYPPLDKNITLQIVSSDPSVVSAPQSVVIPAGGNATFAVSALKPGTSYVGSGDRKTEVRVTSDTFTPVAGEGITNVSTPVSVYIDSPRANAIQSALPVSASVDSSQGNAFLQSPPCSIAMAASDSTFTVTSPLSVQIDQSAANSAALSPSISVYIDRPNDTVTTTAPVSVYLDQSYNATKGSSTVSVYIDQPNSTMKQSAPVSVGIDASSGNTTVLSSPVSAKITPP